MTPPPTLVPSKNALRALRHLAFSTPSIFVGTVGSICGLAVLNYETCRRVRVAEKIVETKRILRSVSSGRDPTHLNDLFEAAERGEDFTLRSRSTRKKRKKPGSRSLSTAAVPHELDQNYTSTPEDIDRRPGSQHVPLARPQSDSRGNVNSDGAYAATDIPVQRVPTRAFRKVAIVSKEEYRLPKHGASNKPRSVCQPKAEEIPGCVERWLTHGAAEEGNANEAVSVSAVFNRISPLLAAGSGRGRDQMKVSSGNGVSAQSQSISPSHNIQSLKAGLNVETVEGTNGESSRLQSPACGQPSSGMASKENPSKLDHPPDDSPLPIETTRSEPPRLSQSKVLGPSSADVPQERLNKATRLRAPTPSHPHLPLPAAAKAGNHLRKHGRRLHWTPLLYTSQAVVDGQATPPGYEHQTVLGDLDLKKYLSETESKRSEEQVASFSIPHHLLVCDADAAMERALREHLDSAKGARLPSASSPSLAPMVDQATQAVDPERLSMLMEFIHPPKRRLSKPTQYRRWTAVMRHFVQQDRSPDWQVAEAIFHACHGLFEAGVVLSRPVFGLLRHLLSTESNYERAQKILFPAESHSWDNSVLRQNAADVVTELATKYLTLFCEHNLDYSARVAEMVKIIDMARRTGYEASEKFALPVLRMVICEGDIEVAQSLLDELDSIYDFRKMQRLWGEYAVWNASSGNWKEAEFMLDRMQETGYSRHQPEQYAAIFHRMLLHYLSKSSAHRAFGFAVNAIKYTGLIPTARISRTIVCACIKEHRYDLVYEWTRLVSEAFPRLTSGFMTPNGAWQLAHALQKAGSSCRDIADTCRAIAHGCYDDPFPHYLRPLLADLVKLDLSRRLNAASALPSEVLFSRDGTPLMTMNKLLEEAQRFCTSPTAPESKTATSDNLKRDIAVQLGAVAELTRIFRGDVFMPDLPELMDHEEAPEPVPTRRSQMSNPRSPAINSTFPDIFRQEKLPPYKDLSASLTDYYATRAKQGIPTDHSLLKHVIDKVSLESPMDALHLIEQIYESEYVQGVQGVPFDNEVFVKWLQVVTMLGSVKAASTVLWAVVDSSRHLTWTLDFSFCLNIVTYICIGSMKGKQKALLTPEMFYLGRRLWWTRLRSPSYVEDDFEFPKWRPWELALRDATLNPT